MADVVVTVPKDLWLDWLEEGDLPGAAWSGNFWSFYLGGPIPKVDFLGHYDPEQSWAVSKVRPSAGLWPVSDAGPDEARPTENLVWERREEGSVYRLVAADQRCYVVAHGRLRGYAPLYAVEVDESGRRFISLIRRGGAHAVTIAAPIIGFRGYRYRWWSRDQEVAFPGWRIP